MEYNTSLKINPEFRDLIPKLSPEEFEQLEQNILVDGCRDALIVWNGQIVDGHNRYEICRKHDIPYRTEEKQFTDQNEAVNWIIDNQMGRRNISEEQKSYLRGLRYRNEKRSDGGYEFVADGKSVGHSDPPIRTSERVAAQFGVSEKTVRRDESFANSLDTIGEYAPSIKAQVLQGHSDLSKADVTAIAKAMPAIVEEVIRPHVANNSGNNEWYTPSEFIESARIVMGGIDLDPASNALANETVKAKTFYSIEDDGLVQDWCGRVWLNPPYSSDLVSRFANKTADEYINGNIDEAIVLVNNATETGWFSVLVEVARAIVFPRTRIKYYGADGVKNSPLQGQAFIYIGENHKKFLDEFSTYGWGAVIDDCSR